MRGQRPACCCGRDDGDRANRGDREGHRSRRRRPRVARGMAEQQREKAADKNGRPGEVPKARAREQIDRPQAQVGGHEERANQIPDAIQRLTPADGASEELRAGADARVDGSVRIYGDSEFQGVVRSPVSGETAGGRRARLDRRGARPHCRCREGCRSRASGRRRLVIARQIVGGLEPGDAARREDMMRRRKQRRIVERGGVDGHRLGRLLLAVDEVAAAGRTELALAPRG